MLRIILFGVICIGFIASGTLNAFDVEWKTQDETVQYKKPVVDEGEVVKKEPFVDDKKIYEEKKKVLDDIYNEEMKPKPKYPEYETEEFELQAEQPMLPPAAGAFGTQGLPPQAVDQGALSDSQTGGSATGLGVPATQPGLPASIPVGQMPGTAVPAGGCQGPTIGLSGGDQTQNGRQAAPQNVDNSLPPPANLERPRGLSSGQFYNSEEDEDVDENESGNSQQQQQQR